MLPLCYAGTLIATNNKKGFVMQLSDKGSGAAGIKKAHRVRL
jgi:hypothetical protein